MASIPNQIRTIDPFADYTSNNINYLTKMVTNNTNCIASAHVLDASITTTNTLTLSPGQCYKDNVLIDIITPYVIDMSNPSFYYETGDLGYAGFTRTATAWDEIGTYWLVLEYKYLKVKPVPEAEIKILRPSERAAFTPEYHLFLKAVNVTGSYQIDSVQDFDGTMKREYTQTHVGVYDNLPTFNATYHEGLLVYIRSEDKLYYGSKYAWVAFNNSYVSVYADTSLLTAGQLGYLDTDGKVKAALADNPATYAQCIVTSVGGPGAGTVVLFGQAHNVQVETGSPINVGDKVYLSITEPGKITSTVTNQEIGTAVQSTTGGLCDIWIQLGVSSSSGGGGDLLSEDLLYHTLLEHSSFMECSYDILTDVTSNAVINSQVTHDLTTSSYKSYAIGAYIESNELVYKSGTYSSFYVHVETDDIANISAEYSTDGGTTWVVCPVDQTYYLPNNGTFSSLKIKFTYNAANISIYSFGVLYDPSNANFTTDVRMYETTVFSQPVASGAVMTLPNNAHYTNDGKSLEVYWNRVRAIEGVDYVELNDTQIQFNQPISVGDRFVFIEKYGYVDISVENKAALDAHKVDDYAHGNIIDDSPINGKTNHSISSNWAYDHQAALNPHTGSASTTDLSTHASTTTGIHGLDNKVDVVPAATVGNIASFDASGGIQDSGVNINSIASVSYAEATNISVGTTGDITLVSISYNSDGTKPITILGETSITTAIQLKLYEGTTLLYDTVTSSTMLLYSFIPTSGAHTYTLKSYNITGGSLNVAKAQITIIGG